MHKLVSVDYVNDLFTKIVEQFHDYKLYEIGSDRKKNNKLYSKYKQFIIHTFHKRIIN